MAFAVKGDFNKFSPDATKMTITYTLATNLDSIPKYSGKSVLFCPTCNIHGHTMDTCYKIHGYPSGYKSKPQPQPSNQSAPINQVSKPNHIKADTVVNNTNGNFFQSLEKSQHNQLMTMSANHLSVTNKYQDEHGHSHSTGTCFSISVPHSFRSSPCWIMDSGASRHICSNAQEFISMQPILNSVVTLPNRAHIDVKLCGDVKINDNLILQDVLFLPEFKFNLVSASSFIVHTEMIISFFHDQFTIKDPTLKRMIGKVRRMENLYVLEVASSCEELASNLVSVQVWHNRLGHHSKKILDRLKGVIDDGTNFISRLE